MEQSSTRTHPIFLAAGAAVLLFSLLGAAALTGVLPVGNSKPGETGALAQKVAAAAPAAHPSQPVAHPSQRMAVAACANCGVIESVQPVEVKGSGSGAGAVAGGVAGGAYAGNEIERNLNRRTVWRVAVRLEDGSLRTLSQKTQPPFAVGERVRIVDGAVERV